MKTKSINRKNEIKVFRRITLQNKLQEMFFYDPEINALEQEAWFTELFYITNLNIDPDEAYIYVARKMSRRPQLVKHLLKNVSHKLYYKELFQ